VRRTRNGFTLLEMVVAMAILAAIAGSLALALRLGIGAVDRGEEVARRMARQRAGIDILTRAIRSSDPTGIPLDNGTAMPYFLGDPDKVRFLSAATLSAAAGGGFRILCLFEARDAAGSGLGVSEGNPFRVDGVERWEGTDSPRIILRDAGEVAFTYSAGPDKDGKWEWGETWDAREKGRLPAAVRVEFLTPSDREALKTALVVPIPAGEGREP